MQGIWFITYLALWILVLAQSFVLVVLLRQLGLRLLNSTAGISRDGLAIGSPAIPILAVDHHGRPLTLPTANRRDALLVFGSVNCGPCQRLLPDLTQFSADHHELDVYFLTSDGVEKNQKFVEEQRLQLLALHSENAAARYKVRVSPFAFVVDSSGRLRAKGLVNRRSDLDALVAHHDTINVTGRDSHQLVGSEEGGT